MKNVIKLTLLASVLVLSSCNDNQDTSGAQSEKSVSSSFSQDYDLTCQDLGLSYLVGDWVDSQRNIVASISDGNCAISSNVLNLNSEKMYEFNDYNGVHDFKWGQTAGQMSSNNSVLTISGNVLTKR